MHNAHIQKFGGELEIKILWARYILSPGPDMMGQEKWSPLRLVVGRLACIRFYPKIFHLLQEPTTSRWQSGESRNSACLSRNLLLTGISYLILLSRQGKVVCDLSLMTQHEIMINENSASQNGSRHFLPKKRRKSSKTSPN